MVLTFILSTFGEALQDNSEGFIRPLHDMLYNSYVVCFLQCVLFVLNVLFKSAKWDGRKKSVERAVCRGLSLHNHSVLTWKQSKPCLCWKRSVRCL